MLNRRHLLRLIPASSLAWWGAARALPAAPAAATPLTIGPPVVQHLRADGFAVSFALGQLATAWIEWGRAENKLDQRAWASQAGLVEASDRAMVIPVTITPPLAPGEAIYYRVVVQTLAYESPYKLHRGEPVAGPTYRLCAADPAAARVRVGVINDTHEQPGTLKALAAQIERVAPEILVWNGDTCASAFNAPADPPRVLLTQAWATNRSLLFVPGNHDVRGAAARTVRDCLAPGPAVGLPYNIAWRHGPLALITLDTGEDKPDNHPVFAGTAAYEPYRVRQAAWLREALARPEIAAAPFKVVFCHIPLRGLPKQNDGLNLDGFAEWSGDGARNWMPALRAAGVHLIVSGHKHAWRIDEAAPGDPLQVVGGGANPGRGETVTLIGLEADRQMLRLSITNAFSGELLAERQLART